MGQPGAGPAYTAAMEPVTTAFIGGGNMARAILGGLIRSGTPAASLLVVEPTAASREQLVADLGVRTLAAAGPELAQADTVVWAVKPQIFQEAARPVAPHGAGALHLSVMAGLRSGDIARAVGTPRVVRAMPNTPALIGQGVAGLYARPEVDAGGRAAAEALLAPTGAVVWVDDEVDLDAVTAVSGSGPAYVFYLIEAMVESAQALGLSAEQGRALTLATLAGATELARRSDEPVSVLRERVTSKGGTTYAALSSLEHDGVKAAWVRALKAAQQRAKELGDEFGAA